MANRPAPDGRDGGRAAQAAINTVEIKIATVMIRSITQDFPMQAYQKYQDGNLDEGSRQLAIAAIDPEYI